MYNVLIFVPRALNSHVGLVELFENLHIFFPPYIMIYEGGNGVNSRAGKYV